MKKFISIICLFLVITSTYSQVVKGLNARLFHIVSTKGDTIYFLKTDTCLTQKKPTILFCQGSLPIPLIIDLGVKKFIPSLNNFDYKELSKRYNLIVISMPRTPPIVKVENLNKRYEFVPDTTKQLKFDSLYLQDNYLENYVTRANSVLTYLRKQKWLDNNRIVVFGHSQGSYIALELAKQNPSIRATGYSGGTPSGRFSLYVRQQRRDVITNTITAEEGQKNIEGYYDTWKSYCKGIDPTEDNADRAKAWLSFSKPLWNDLIHLKTPIYIAYGTEDLASAEGCELLPIYFEQAGKTNYKMMPLVGCGHNFEEISPEGVSNYDKMHWDDVMNGFVKWVESL